MYAPPSHYQLIFHVLCITSPYQFRNIYLLKIMSPVSNKYQTINCYGLKKKKKEKKK